MIRIGSETTQAAANGLRAALEKNHNQNDDDAKSATDVKAIQAQITKLG